MIFGTLIAKGVHELMDDWTSSQVNGIMISRKGKQYVTHCKNPIS